MNKTYKVNVFSDCALWNTHTDYFNGDTELKDLWLFTVRVHCQSPNQNAYVPSRGSLYQFYDRLWYDPAWA